MKASQPHYDNGKDYDYVEVNEINSQTETKGIDVTLKGWKRECKSILGI